MAEILIATKREDWYLEQLIPRCHNQHRSRDRSQWNDLLGNLMKRGNALARRTLDCYWKEQLLKDYYGPVSAFLRNGTPSDYQAVLLHLEATWSKKRKVHPEGWYLHSQAEGSIGEKRAAKIRQPFLVQNPKFAKIADFPEVKIRKEHNPRGEFDTVEEAILSGQVPYRHLLDGDGLAKVVELLKGDLEDQSLRRALQIFSYLPFPGDVQILVRFLDHENERIGRMVLNAFEHTKSPLIRETIMNRTFGPDVSPSLITALTSNFRPGDEKWIENQIGSHSESWQKHSARIGMLEVVEKNPKGQWSELLKEAYEFSACQICRRSFATELHKRRALPRIELEALQYDAYDFTRSWAAKALRKLDRKAAKASR